MLPRLPIEEDPEAEDPLDSTILLREGVREFRPRSRGWRTLR